ncbi:MAG: hypothetical protein ACJ761_06390 [Chloroflexota bacterium]
MIRNPMEPSSPAEALPELYRAILDGVAELERAGLRADAARLRASATRVYSTSWDAAARRRLQTILREAHRTAALDSRDGRIDLRERSAGGV